MKRIAAIYLLFLLLVASTAAPNRAAGGEGSRFYPARYFPSAIDRSTAVAVVLRPGEVATGLDLALKSAGGLVRGTVSGAGDPAVPLDHLLVEARLGSIVVQGQTDAAGRFSLEGVPAGLVRFRFSTDAPLTGGAARAWRADWYPGDRDSANAETVQIENGGSIALQPVTLAPAASLRGRVVADTPLAGARVRVLRYAEDGALVRGWTVIADSEGQFALGGLPPGSYRVLYLADDSPYVSVFQDGARDTVSAALLELGVGEYPEPIVVHPPLGGSIHGTIRGDGSLEPIADAIVFALRLSDRRWFRTQADQFGRYEVRGLSSGPHKIYVSTLRRWHPDVVHEEDSRPITVVEPNSVFNIDVSGARVGDCHLNPGSAGVIKGTLRVDFSQVESAKVVAWSEADTVEVDVTNSSSYLLPCVEEGTYRVALVPVGPYRTQFHAKVDRIEEATLLTVVPPDSVDRIDFEPRRSVELRGRVADGDSQEPLPNLLVTALEETSGVALTTRTGDDGAYVFARLADGSGLPAGRWFVRAESTVVPDPSVTPALAASLSAERLAAGLRLHWQLAGPESADWDLRLSREGRDESDLPVSIVEFAASRAGAAGSFLARSQGVATVYRLEAHPSDAPSLIVSAELTVDAAEFAPTNPLPLTLTPSPWRPGVPIRAQLAEGVSTTGGRITFFDAGGRAVLMVPVPRGARTVDLDAPVLERALPSGLYFARFSAEGSLLGLDTGRATRATTFVVIR